MEFIDTHCHLDDEVYAPDRDEVIARARQAGVIMMLQADIDSSERDAMLALTDARPDGLRPLLGL
ncbi:MAG: TatD family hydrolase [Bacteroidales bacterium]|nr:TatD family hydrolase [Bacteroidales bacterium]